MDQFFYDNLYFFVVNKKPIISESRLLWIQGRSQFAAVRLRELANDTEDAPI
jgi:hypothetical protein